MAMKFLCQKHYSIYEEIRDYIFKFVFVIFQFYINKIFVSSIWFPHCDSVTFFFKDQKYFTRSSHQRCSVKKGVFKSFAKFAGKHLCQSLLFNKVAGHRSVFRCFPVNFAKFKRTSFLQNTSGRLLLCHWFPKEIRDYFSELVELLATNIGLTERQRKQSKNLKQNLRKKTEKMMSQRVESQFKNKLLMAF